MADAIDYASLQEIREEAGRQYRKIGEALDGSANGSNDTFYTRRKDVVDSDYDDDLGTDDLTVYVNGTAVSVSAVDGTTGEITLASPPANGATVTADYDYSGVRTALVTRCRKAAIDVVERAISGILDPSDWSSSGDIPGELQSIVVNYAAGLLLIRDHGAHADTNESSKDGYKRLAWAKKALKEYIAGIEDDSDTTAKNVSHYRTDGNIFKREDDLDELNDTVSVDDAFMHGD